MPTNEYYIFGTTGIKVKEGGIFSLGYHLLGVNILQVKTNKIIDYLKVSYFSISPKPNQICSQCRTEKYIQNDGWEGKCVSQCSSD